MFGGTSKALLAILAAIILAGCGGAAQSGSSTASAAAPAPMPSPLPAPILGVNSLCRLTHLAPAKLRSQPGYVEFSVTVRDQNGNAVQGLNQQDFAVTAGAKTVPVAYFHELGPMSPISMFVVGDVSSTMYNKTVVSSGSLEQTRAALGNATGSMSDCDEVGVVLVGGEYATGIDPATLGMPSSLDKVTLVQPFTTDHELAMAKIYSVVPSGKDYLAEGIRRALDGLANADYPRRVLVVLTDGLDPQAIDAGVRLLQQHAPVDLWVIGIGDPDAAQGRLVSLLGTRRLDTAAVKRLAAAGGGHTLFAAPVDSDQGASLAKAIAAIASESRKGYAIGAVVSEQNPPPRVTLTKTQGEVQSEIVPLKMLADAESRPVPPPAPSCFQHTPEAVSLKPGYTQLDVSVIDADGQPVHGLQQSDLVVYSDKERYPIIYFASGPGSHSIMIAVDSSGSMGPKIAKVREETAKLISGLNPSDRVGLVAFSGKPYLLSPLTSDHDKVKEYLRLLHAYGQTSMYDALVQCMTLLLPTSRCGRTIILITDGMDNTSRISETEMLTRAAREHVAIYAIGIGNPDQRDRFTLSSSSIISTSDGVDKAALDAMGKSAGGADFIVPPIDSDQGADFARAMAAVDSRLRDGYTVGFIAPHLDQPVHVAVTGHDDYIVRTSAPMPGGK